MTANTPKGYPYPEDTDPLSDVAEWVMSLANAVDSKLVKAVHAGSATAVIPSNASAANVGVNLPAGKFSAPPIVVATTLGASLFMAYVTSSTADAIGLGARQIAGTNGAANVNIQYVAVQLA